MKKYNHFKGIDLRKSIPLNLHKLHSFNFTGFIIVNPYNTINLCYGV